ncbi:MAG TPA: hypothetical protein VF553_22990 [Pyrinomonadaceae bacterium]
MKERRFSRRDFIYLGLGGGLMVAGLRRAISQQREAGQLFAPTPSNSLGPFYKRGAPRREVLTEAGAAGNLLLVAGRIINTDGKALSGATLEVFHADAEGEYDMQGYRYRGEIPVGVSGAYGFESIVPGAYGGRAQHLHYVVNAPGHRRLVTQLYFENDPKFAGSPDKNFNRDSLVQHRELIRPVKIVSKNNASYSSVVFDICLEKA